jgi:hypothetical protein
MLWRKAQESTYIDATVIAVHGDRELLYLETPDQDEALVVIPCPPKYELPRKGDLVKLELRLELRPDKRRRSWRTYIIMPTKPKVIAVITIGANVLLFVALYLLLRH